MPNLDRPALRHAARHFGPWLLLLVAVAYVVLAVMTASITTGIYAALFLSMGVCVTVWRYRTCIDDRERAAERATYRERRAAEHAERLATMARYDAQRDEEIRSGARCPEWCDACDDEQRLAAAETARFLRERAARHGHPGTLDEDRRDALVELNARLHPGYLSPDELLDDESLAHLHAT